MEVGTFGVTRGFGTEVAAKGRSCDEAINESHVRMHFNFAMFLEIDFMISISCKFHQLASPSEVPSKLCVQIINFKIARSTALRRVSEIQAKNGTNHSSLVLNSHVS
jgi:hypothetical protein